MSLFCVESKDMNQNILIDVIKISLSPLKAAQELVYLEIVEKVTTKRGYFFSIPYFFVEDLYSVFSIVTEFLNLLFYF